ncbi:uncharacterized protein NDAI_0B03160 [Naumovozyma dairenensis CBS 421]|uniref:dolichyl-phosphate-mannose--protein mannosyltransferase n=1 Tax=Naumovozyma dairenensis (strain ATCC 10597 / BCRC 20456 / CBS 421 / NBRC 0211 / NRRL Y-12639) TaxID=1071378 RepID=G0W6E0_NAUDC|nr:hypothetical protein NDAI_0B03160 [Naumovozyma dairenensis CBS 421]CCD23351.1 hypothetical protein NDAI_0B03160 [Naumovozyma dairenensis CBS 421]
MAVSKGTKEKNPDAVEEPIVQIPEVKSGPLRPYLNIEPSNHLVKSRTIQTFNEKVLVATLWIFTSIIRLHDLSWPNSVVFDEVVYGGFASKYLKGTFFLDVNPPLVKLLYAAIGYLSGFKGSFDFGRIGAAFSAATPYVLMRSLSALLGSFTVVVLYLTLRVSGVRIWVALATAICLAVENSYVTVSRFIMLDSPLVFFIALAVYFVQKSELYQAGSIKSYFLVFLSSISLGFAISSKWVAVGAFAWVGLMCLFRLWFMVGDLNRSVCSSFKIAAIKIATLLVVPFCMYVFVFYLHFQLANVDSSISQYFTQEFRTALINNTIPQDIPAEVGVGSRITLRHTGTNGGYLHSHSHYYETGSNQQQISLYPYEDGNNEWLVELYDKPLANVTEWKNLTSGMKIKLLHNTFCRVHTHDHKPPVSENSDWQKEVSCYGFENFEGDGNDDWIIEIDEDESVPGEAQQHIRALETKFRLKHAIMGCYLFSHETKLDKKGFNQQEVTCGYSGKDYLTTWYVESNENPLLPDETDRVSYQKPTFLDKFIETHKKILHVSGKIDNTHPYESSPFSWPLMPRGIDFWNEGHQDIYLLGNAVVWWSVTAFIALFLGNSALQLLRWQLGYELSQDPVVINFHLQVIQYLLGFILNFAPSLLFKGQLFLNNYLPAYYFGILALGHGLEMIVSYFFERRKSSGYVLIVVFVFMAVRFFSGHSSLVYGTRWTTDLCEQSKLLSDWDYDCSSFYSTYREYDAHPDGTYEGNPLISPSKTLAAPAPPTPIPGAPLTEIEKFDEVVDDGVVKKFIDQNGNEIPEEEARRLIAEQGGSFERVVNGQVKGEGEGQENIEENIQENAQKNIQENVQEHQQEHQQETLQGDVQENEEPVKEEEAQSVSFEPSFDNEESFPVNGGDKGSQDGVAGTVHNDDGGIQEQPETPPIENVHAAEQELEQDSDQNNDEAFEQILHEPIPKKFVDENGNELDPEVARKMVQEGGSFERLQEDEEEPFPTNTVDIESLIHDGKPKKFIDEFGNELSPEDAKRLVEEQGGIVEEFVLH